MEEALTDEAATTYRLAYLFAQKDRAIYDEMRTFLLAHGRADALAKIDSEYGAP